MFEYKVEEERKNIRGQYYIFACQSRKKGERKKTYEVPTIF